ncbi:ABC transporter permease [Streptomyces sp. NPDC086554]|uniref:ABC transporter permease n=1 Tax=Streptomyces sp. NPDC086554 TaxID=3154864 RepID=UPI00343BE32F
MKPQPHRQRRTGTPRLAFRDLATEALAGLVQRPLRSGLTALGTVLGVATFVAILGLTATASSQIDTRFNAMSATEVSVADATDTDQGERVPFPEDADQRIQRLNGVQGAGVYWNVSGQSGNLTVQTTLLDDTGTQSPNIVAASPGLLQAVEPTVHEGRTFEAFHARKEDRVAVIGTGLAESLGIGTLNTQPAILIDDKPFSVIGIISDVQRKPDLLMAVVVPNTTAHKLWGAPHDKSTRMLISTDMGAAQQIADEAPLALDPAHANWFKSVPPPNPKTLRASVTSDLNQLFLLLAAICLTVGTIGIANITLVAVLERSNEIGLRRALGARARHIAAQFLAESGILGALGGLVGSSLGIGTVVAVAVARDWTPVLHPETVAVAPVIGLATGVLAGLYPAWRASRIQPVEALRR